MSEHARIILDTAILAGKPVVRGTRLSVDFIIGLLADGWTEADVLRNYPGLVREDISACLAYARDVLRSEKSLSERGVRCVFLPMKTSRAMPSLRCAYSDTTACGFEPSHLGSRMTP